MTDFFKRLLNQPEPPAAPDVPPAEMAAYLRSLDDRQWGRYAFRREPLEGKFTPQQKDAYTAAANACGAEWADKLAAEHGTRDPLTLCGELGLKLETPATPAGGLRVIGVDQQHIQRVGVEVQPQQLLRERHRRDLRQTDDAAFVGERLAPQLDFLGAGINIRVRFLNGVEQLVGKNDALQLGAGGE